MPYTIGIDGGGTKTEAVAIREDGEQLAACSGGAGNAFAVGFEGALAAVQELLVRLWRESGLAPNACVGVCIGLAGVGREQERRAWRDALTPFLREHGAGSPVTVCTDAEIALFAALGKREGVVAISGTGSIVLGFAPDGAELRVGGWGHLLGDGGSGYSIGLRTLQTVMDSYDGVRPPTQLTAPVLALAGAASPPELKDYVYAPERKKQDIAAFARICIEAGALGDPSALAVLEREAAALAEQTAALLRRHPPFADGAVALAGSIFARCDVFRSGFEAALLGTNEFPRLRLVPMERSAAYGAAAMAFYDLNERSS